MLNKSLTEAERIQAGFRRRFARRRNLLVEITAKLLASAVIPLIRLFERFAVVR